MSNVDSKLIKLVKKHMHNNEVEILHSETCSCIFCRQQYSARNISDWVNDKNGMNAICPECGMDTVVGDASKLSLDKELLKELNLALYGEDYMYKHPDAAKKYILRYQEGKITHKKSNELLYIQYLSLLSSLGDENCTFLLGNLYEFGTEFTPKDAKTAFSYYSSNLLKNKPNVFNRLGVLCASNELGKVDEKGAYESFAKGMALGDLDSLLNFSDCYLNGVNVHVDKEFALNILLSVWGECYQRFTFSMGKDINVFPSLCYRIGKAYENGYGCDINIETALYFYLLSEFAYRLVSNNKPLIGEDKNYAAIVSDSIKKLSEDLNASRGDPIFDDETFIKNVVFSFNNQFFPLTKNEISNAFFDENEHIFEFDVKYNIPPLLVDIRSLYCGFIVNNIHWIFYDVASVNVTNNRFFNYLNIDENSNWKLAYEFNNQNETAAEITFLDSESDQAINNIKGDSEA